MSSFLDRLKKKEIVPTTPDDKKQEQVAAQNTPATPPAAATPAEQLKVDIFQTPNSIIVYAQIAGASVHDFSVSIDGDGDIVTIKGDRTRPNGEHFDNQGADNKEHVLEECSWGKFYRQIILPAEVDAAKTEAKMKDGVLMLSLPLKQISDKGVRINVVQV